MRTCGWTYCVALSLLVGTKKRGGGATFIRVQSDDYSLSFHDKSSPGMNAIQMKVSWHNRKVTYFYQMTHAHIHVKSAPLSLFLHGIFSLYTSGIAIPP